MTNFSYRLGQSRFEAMLKDTMRSLFGTPSAAPLGRLNPVIASKGAAVSLTGTTAETVLATIAIPAGSMGAKGALRITTTWSFTTSANLKTLRARLGGLSGTAFLALAPTASLTAQSQVLISNRDVENAQVGYVANATASFTVGNGAQVTGAIDTSADTTLVLTGQLALGSETITLERYLVELLRPPA